MVKRSDYRGSSCSNAVKATNGASKAFHNKELLKITQAATVAGASKMAT